MRRILPPFTAAAIAAILTLSLVSPRRLPASLLEPFAGDGPPLPPELMIEGGTEVELRIVAAPGDAGAPSRVADRLAAVGFQLDIVGPERIFAYLASSRGAVSGAIGNAGLTWPFAIGVVPPRHAHRPPRAAEYPRIESHQIAEIETRGDSSIARPVDPGSLGPLRRAAQRGESIAVLDRESGAPRVEAEIAGEVIRFEGLWMPELIRPAGGLVELVETWDVAPVMSRSATWCARSLLAGLVAIGVFIAFALAARGRHLRGLVDRDDNAAGRVRVAAAAVLTVAIVGAGVLRGDTGPFMASIHAGLLGVGHDVAPLDLGYFTAVCGFVAALWLTLLIPRWRRDLICDGRAGVRLMRRGLVMTALAAVFLLLSPALDKHVNLVLGGATAGDALIFAIAALGLTAAVLATASRAIGGAWVCAPLAVLVPACLQLSRELVRAQDAGDIGAGALALIAVLIAAVCATTCAVVSRRFGEASLRAPVGGLMPLSIGAGIAAVYAVWLGNVPFGSHVGVQAVIAISLVIAAALFELRIRRGLGGAQVSSLARTNHGAELAAIATSVLFTAVLLGVDLAARHLEIATFAALAALTTAALMDVSSELRARWRRPTLSPAWQIHQPQLAGLVERALDGRGLAYHMRGQYLRTCLGIFGPFVPITALVDRDRVAEARELIRSVLS